MQVGDKKVTISLPEDCIAMLIDMLADKVQSNATYIEWLTRENQRLNRQIMETANMRVQDDDPFKGDSEA